MDKIKIADGPVPCKTKICAACGRRKPRGEFHRHAGTRSGLQSYCKDCQLHIARRWRNDNRDHVNAHRRGWGAENRGLLAAAKARHRARHHDRERARQIITNLRKRGVLYLPPCAHCGSTDNLEAHHPRYDRPFQVVSLCRDCHKAADVLRACGKPPLVEAGHTINLAPLTRERADGRARRERVEEAVV